MLSYDEAARIMMGGDKHANIQGLLTIYRNGVYLPGNTTGGDYYDKDADGVYQIEVMVPIPEYKSDSISISENNVTIKASDKGLNGFDEVTVVVDTSDAYEQGVIDGKQEQKEVCDEEKAELIDEIVKQDDIIGELEKEIDEAKDFVDKHPPSSDLDALMTAVGWSDRNNYDHRDSKWTFKAIPSEKKHSTTYNYDYRNVSISLYKDGKFVTNINTTIPETDEQSSRGSYQSYSTNFYFKDDFFFYHYYSLSSWSSYDEYFNYILK